MVFKPSAFQNFQAAYYSRSKEFHGSYNDSSERNTVITAEDEKEYSARGVISGEVDALERLLVVDGNNNELTDIGDHHVITGGVLVYKTRFQHPSFENIAEVFYHLGQMNEAYSHISGSFEEKKFLKELYGELVQEFNDIMAQMSLGLLNKFRDN